MFTQRALLLGFVAFCFYLIAVVNSLPTFYYVLTWLTLGLSLASLGLAVLSLSGLETTWSWAKTQGQAALSPLHPAPEEGAPVFEIEFRNNASLGKTGVLLELHFERVEPDKPDATKIGEVSSSKTKKRGSNAARNSHTFLIEAIPAGTSVQVSVPLRFLSRGHHRLREIRLVGSDVLGVFRVTRRLQWQGEDTVLTVGPAILEDVSAILAQGGGHSLSGPHRTRALGRGDEVRGTRAYVPGDDLRHIHWKSTARTGELTVREWEHTGRPAALLVWSGTGDSIVTETGLCLVASLAVALGRSQTPRVLAILGAQCESLVEREGSGKTLSSLENELLARARNGLNTLFSEALAHAIAGDVANYDAIFVVASPWQTDDETFWSTLERWLSRGAKVTVLWLQPAMDTVRKRVRKSPASQRSDAQWQRLEQCGVRALQLPVEASISAETVREFLLRIA